MRREGWESLLATYLESPAPFAWGENDCVLNAARWVRACTGQDKASAHRGTYKTARGAKARLKRLGHSNPEALADSVLTRKPVALAQRGDIVLHPQGALGVCNGIKSHFLTADGMTTHLTLDCTAAWVV